VEPNFINKIGNQFSVKYADRANLEAHENRSGVIGIKNLFQDLFYYTGREILRVVLLPFRTFSFVVHLVGVIRTLGCNLKAWEELGDSAKLLGSTLVRATIGAPLQIITAVFSSILQIGHSSGATGRKIAAGLDDFMDSEIERYADDADPIAPAAPPIVVPDAPHEAPILIAPAAPHFLIAPAAPHEAPILIDPSLNENWAQRIRSANSRGRAG
jgi:hypothetical protein